MQRTGTYYKSRDRGSFAKDAEAWLANGLATILAGCAIAAGAIGMLMAFGYINEDSTNAFQDGMTWLVAALVLAICANVFRREHHVVDNTELLRSGRMDSGERDLGEQGRGPYTEPRSEERVPPHRHD